MTTKHIPPDALTPWVRGLMANRRVMAPQAHGNRFVFDVLENAEDARLDYDVSLLPPKKYFLPPHETLLAIRPHGFTTVVDSQPFVLLGVHPYDMVAINQMDRLFTNGMTDTHYLARREHATIVVMDVQTPAPHAFAGCLGVATVEGRNSYDAYLTKLDDDSYVIEATSAAGKKLLVGLRRFPAAAPEALTAREHVRARNHEALRRYTLLPSPDAIGGLLDRHYDHPIWEELATRCHSCGSCNLVCPTCYCFNVRDEVNADLTSGSRVREWDSCALPRFATVAGGHSFRERRAARLRHRYYRKGRYVPDMIGEFACVGCGRCIDACTTGVANPVAVFNRLYEDDRA